MRKVLIALLAAAVIPITLTACNVTHKDYSSNVSDANPASAESGEVASAETEVDDKIIGYDIYRPGQDDSSGSSIDSDSGSEATSSANAASGGTSSSGSSSAAASSSGNSSKTSSGDSSSKTSSSTSSKTTSSSANEPDDETSSYYDDWEGDNVINFSDLLNGGNGNSSSGG